MTVKAKVKADSTAPEQGQPISGKRARVPKTAKPPRGASPAHPPTRVAMVRASLGVTQAIFARMLGVSARSVAAWEAGQSVHPASLRRVNELERLGNELREVMQAEFIPTWLTSPSEGLSGLSPVETLERGENDRLWRSVFLLGSGLPI